MEKIKFVISLRIIKRNKKIISKVRVLEKTLVLKFLLKFCSSVNSPPRYVLFGSHMTMRSLFTEVKGVLTAYYIIQTGVYMIPNYSCTMYCVTKVHRHLTASGSHTRHTNIRSWSDKGFTSTYSRHNPVVNVKF